MPRSLSQHELVHDEVTVVNETDKAFLCFFERDDDEPLERWVPKSVIADADDIVVDGETEQDIAIAKWWYEQNIG